MKNYTGHFIDMSNLLESKNSFSNSKRYFERFLDQFNLSKKRDIRANICEANGKILYFTGAENVYWWGFGKNVIAQQAVDYLVARAAEGNDEFFVVIPVKENMRDTTDRVMVSAGGTGDDFWVNFGDGNYKVTTNNKSDVFRTDAKGEKIYLSKENN